MSTLAEHMIVACAENRPPMLESQCMTHGRVKYAELSEQEKLQDDCDVEAINIILQGLPPDVYSLINHHKVAKDIWDRVNLLMKGTELSYQERKCKVYNEFHKFTSVKGETLYAYYLRFSQLINDMHIIGMTMQQVKLYAYLSQPERHANEVRLLSERYLDPLAFVAHHQTQEMKYNLNGNNASVQAMVVKVFIVFQQRGIWQRQCTQPKRLRTSNMVKEKIVTQRTVQGIGICPSIREEQIAFFSRSRNSRWSKLFQTTMQQNAAFQD
ncbi:hypothetical protein Tco_1533145 [Tanacetum coccineum]